MAHTPYRSILGIISIASFIIASYLLLNVSVLTGADAGVCPAAISVFNISIIAGWLGFGTAGGTAITFVSFLFALWVALKSGRYGCSAYTLTFCVSGAAGYFILDLKDKVERSYRLKAERAGEEINIVSSEISGKEEEISSTEKKLLRYAALREVSEALSVALDLDNVNTIIVDRAQKTLDKPGRVLLYLVDAVKQELALSASKNGEKIKEKRGDFFDRWTLKHRKPLIIESLLKEFRFPAEEIERSKESFRSLIAAPLVSENKVIGMLRMDSPAESEYTQDDLRLLGIISDLGAVAVQNALLYSKTQELAITDSLTGLAVRRYFLERFKKDLLRTAQNKGALSLLMLDIDHFKDFNDRYGHAAGDLILKHVSRSIRSMVREGDMAARYGGEEVSLLLFGTDKKQAAADAEAIRKRIEKQPLLLRRQMVRITVSIGVASFPEDAAVEEDLIKTADERLYKAKAQGRNRVCAS